MLGFNRVAGFSGQHDLFVATRHADAVASCIASDSLRNCLGVGHDVDIEHPDQFLIDTEDRHIGRARFFALNVEHAIGYRQNIGDLSRADNRGGERRTQGEGAGFEPGHLKVADGNALGGILVLRLRACGSNTNSRNGKNHATQKSPLPAASCATQIAVNERPQHLSVLLSALPASADQCLRAPQSWTVRRNQIPNALSVTACSSRPMPDSGTFNT